MKHHYRDLSFIGCEQVSDSRDRRAVAKVLPYGTPDEYIILTSAMYENNIVLVNNGN